MCANARTPVFAGPPRRCLDGKTRRKRAFMRSLQGAQRAGTCSEVPHAAGVPIAFAPERFSGEREGHIGGKRLKVNLTACNQANPSRAHAPMTSAPISNAISMRTRRRSIDRTAFTMASATRAHLLARDSGPCEPRLAERPARRNASHPTREGLSPTIPQCVVSRTKLVHWLAP